MSIEQVLLIIRALFAMQIDREPNEAREWLLRQIVDALTVEEAERRTSIAIRDALLCAARCEKPAVEARAQIALKAVNALSALDDVLTAQREARDEAMFGDRADADTDTRRADGEETPRRR